MRHFTNEVHHVSVLGNNTSKPASATTHESAQRPVNNSDHTSKGVLQGNVNGGTNGNSTGNTAHNTVPAKPVTPTKPAETKPAKPVTPSKPVDTKPVEPVAPTKPTEPSKPTTPNKPAEPTTPSKPVVPTTPTTPAKPTESSKPVQPTQPSKPVEPTTPTDNSKQALTTSQMEQIFWDKYMAPAGYQKGNIPVSDYQVKTGEPDEHVLNETNWDNQSAYMTLHNYHYVNTSTSKNEFLQDTKETADQYGWNNMISNGQNTDGQKYQKASIRVTQSSPDDIRMDALWYN